MRCDYYRNFTQNQIITKSEISISTEIIPDMQGKIFLYSNLPSSPREVGTKIGSEAEN